MSNVLVYLNHIDRLLILWYVKHITLRKCRVQTYNLRGKWGTSVYAAVIWKLARVHNSIPISAEIERSGIHRDMKSEG